jgi:hypothetical protein
MDNINFIYLPGKDTVVPYDKNVIDTFKGVKILYKCEPTRKEQLKQRKIYNIIKN